MNRDASPCLEGGTGEEHICTLKNMAVFRNLELTFKIYYSAPGPYTRKEDLSPQSAVRGAGRVKLGIATKDVLEPMEGMKNRTLMLRIQG